MTSERENVRFVRFIEKRPSLYDPGVKGYAHKHVTQRAWGEVAKEFKITVKECKDRWKNIRTVFRRHLNLCANSETGESPRKDYYLSEVLQFLIPSLKDTQQKPAVVAAPQPLPPPPKPVQQAPQQQQQMKRPVMMKPLAPKPRPASPPQPPPPPPEVCLRWNSYHSNMQATFPALLNNEQFVDVTLACEGRSIKCHKMILSACSSYFDELLSQNPCQHPIVLMKDLKFWEVQALVEFMYRGEVNVGQDKLPFLLAAAEALQIKGLASPASSTPQHDDDSMSLGLDSEDYMDDIEVPSPSSARRSRKRRTIAAIPAQVTPPPAPVPAPRSARLYRNNNHHQSPAQPSTSGYMPSSLEPPTRKRRMDGPEFDANHHIIREIKLEPVDIDASSDSMDHPPELFQMSCEPPPAELFLPTCDRPPAFQPSDLQHDDDAVAELKPQTTLHEQPGNTVHDDADSEGKTQTTLHEQPDDTVNDGGEGGSHDAMEDSRTGQAGGDTTKPCETTDEPSPSIKAEDAVQENGPHTENEPHTPVQDKDVDMESPSEDVTDPVSKPGDSEPHEETAADPPEPPASSDSVPVPDN